MEYTINRRLASLFFTLPNTFMGATAIITSGSRFVDAQRYQLEMLFAVALWHLGCALPELAWPCHFDSFSWSATFTN
jgi:hypothetical protein